MFVYLVCVYLISSLHIAAGKFLQVNKWHEFLLLSDEQVTLDLSLFMSCERFSMLVATDRHDLSRLNLTFNEEELYKVDVDSPETFEVPSPPPVVGGCRETNRKSLRITLISRINKIEIRLQEQVITRPKHNYSDTIRILLPQKQACCLILGNLSNERVTSKPTFRPMMGDQTSPKPSTSEKYQRLSWTEVVNREWSTSFIICSTCIAIMMVVMITFGICTFIYLQTQPRGGKKLYTAYE
ncbi:unnamed protein product [Cylicocyclus nassatus]|uniref:Uncharacterized protein n=1 Tax=Cylicocyclus nassatus TaxID=53992 RepID=A0AA36HAM4_CYLNA|nr:unnamed protein product [Cylicocyclus nassatus]